MSLGSVLIVGAHRGLGYALCKRYAEVLGPDIPIFATVEQHVNPADYPKSVKLIPGVDCSQKDCAEKVIAGLEGNKVDLAIYVSGVVKPEEFGSASWDDQLLQYKICSVAPVMVIEKLVTSSSLAPNAKVAMLTSEAGSITLRTESEGGSSYGHHGCKAAGNMIGHLLSYNLKEKGHPLVMLNEADAYLPLQPGFMKTDMTKAMGLESMYDELDAKTAEEAAVPLVDFLATVDMSKTGKLWAPNGSQGIGSAEEAMGKEWASLPGPIALPW
ncbi:hypothetical protein P7C73_g5959, partial [Tremellales sp. Uapishka_1]